MSGIKSKIAKYCFLFSRSRVGGAVVGWVFANMSDFLPVNKLYETEHVLAFYHPRPVHPVHILIVPKKTIRSFVEIKESDMPIVAEVMKAAQHLVKTLDLEPKGYRFMINGGVYQDVKQVHFHLISGPQHDPA